MAVDVRDSNNSVLKKRVCIFCQTWESGGIEAFISNALTHMDLSNLEVDIVAEKLNESVFTDRLRGLGITFRELSGSQRRLIKNYRLFEKLIKVRGYDVVHLNIFQGLSFYYGCLAKKARVPTRIAHSHGSGLRDSPGKALKLCLHRLGKKMWSSSVTDFWACSRGAAKFLFPKGQAYQWIPNGIETERFRFQPESRAAERHALGLTENTLLVGTVGRLSEEKNHSFLLKVFCELKKLRRNSVLLLVGTGCLEERLRTQARELGVERNVIFYGASSQVERLLWAMDVFVLPSYFEGLPVTSVEAQTTGLPCFFSDAVTRECKILDTARFLPLTKSPTQWAIEILQETTAGDRCAAAFAARDAGFDVLNTAQRVELSYRRSDVP